jgi:hypothetical protein
MLRKFTLALVIATVASIVGINVAFACEPPPPPPCEPEINIKPYSYPNVINFNGNGAITVAILSIPCLDAADVDVNTADFEGASPWKSKLEDVDSDGDMDLVMHFRIKDITGLTAGDTSATLTWQDIYGNSYSASDSVIVRGL